MDFAKIPPAGEAFPQRWTPGPWKRGSCDDSIVWAERFRASEFASHPNDPHGEFVAVACAEGINLGMKDRDDYKALPPSEKYAIRREQDANAALIESAPELAHLALIVVSRLDVPLEVREAARAILHRATAIGRSVAQMSGEDFA